MIYQPREDSFLLKKEIKKRAKGKSFLDMGSGTGIQARAAISAGASSVLAADINKESIRELKNQNIPAVCSNLFSKIREKFDIISFNPPYLPKDKLEGKESALATSGGKQGDEIILKFLKQAKSHLKKNGIILLVISSLTPKKRIFALLKKQGLKHKALSSEKFFFEALEVWLLR
jgi:release factor glutamine methyltransferase